ncbi:cupin-like domain-containing protein [Paraglaciecola polaris]|uniref:cupin-like domain-containing protein n=1 Tax=Paraglaciecola polaris TaxID=222814 RepID=UPI0030EBD2F1|tara:strand:- start:882 stop:1922 length:1041 start_codon:yes stop_codon:yes gene_type:complete
MMNSTNVNDWGSLESMPPPREVWDVSPDNFKQKITDIYQPAVLRGFAANWPVVKNAQISDSTLRQYLRGFDSQKPLQLVNLPSHTQGRMFYDQSLTGMNFKVAQATLAQGLEEMQRFAEGSTSDRFCLQSIRIKDYLPALESQLNNPLLPQSRPFIWIGNKVTVAPHFDEAHNIAIVVGGKRRFTLFPPEQVKNLYVGPLEFTPAGQPISLVDLRAPDIAQHPKYVQAFKHGLSVELEPGDAIYIPSPWWHHVESLSNLNVLINYWWSGNKVSTALPFPMLIHAIQALKSQPYEQQQAWKSMLEHYLFDKDTDPGEHIPQAAKGILGQYTDKVSHQVHQWLAKLLG